MSKEPEMFEPRDHYTATGKYIRCKSDSLTKTWILSTNSVDSDIKLTSIGDTVNYLSGLDKYDVACIEIICRNFLYEARKALNE